MVSITDSPTHIQGIGPGKLPAVDEFHVAEDYNTTEEQTEDDHEDDHEDEEAMRRRLEEWRAMAANLTGGFTQMPDAVTKDSTLSSNEKLVYQRLLGFMWDKEWCWPGQKRIASDLGISRRTVIRACKVLHGRGYIEKWRRGLGRTNVYFINPLTFVVSTGIVLTQINLHLPKDVVFVAGSPVADLYNTTFYANDPIPAITGKCQNDTSRSDKKSLTQEPKSHTKHTKQKDTYPTDRDSNDSTGATKGTVSPVAATTIRSGNDTKPNKNGTNNNQAPNITKPSKTNSKTNGIEQAAAERVEDVKTSKTEQKPSAQAAAISAVTGIPTEHLTELGIAQEPRKRPIPDFVTNIMHDFTRELGDSPKSAKSNNTRAAKLYYFAYDFIREAQEDPEGYYTNLLYQAREAARRVTNIQHRTGNRLNRIPVFFTCLENSVELNDDERLYVRSDLPLLHPEDR